SILILLASVDVYGISRVSSNKAVTFDEKSKLVRTEIWGDKKSEAGKAFYKALSEAGVSSTDSAGNEWVVYENSHGFKSTCTRFPNPDSPKKDGYQCVKVRSYMATP